MEELSTYGQVIPLGFLFRDCGIRMERSVIEVLWDRIRHGIWLSALEDAETIKGRGINIVTSVKK